MFIIIILFLYSKQTYIRIDTVYRKRCTNAIKTSLEIVNKLSAHILKKDDDNNVASTAVVQIVINRPKRVVRERFGFAIDVYYLVNKT